jgi:DNA-3-methyladenine glycosylase II
LNLETLYEKSDEEIFDLLLPIRGIGRWTVECFLLFGVGRPNLLPAADIGLRNAIRNVYQLKEQPDEKTVRKMGDEWAPYCSYITLYLWDTLRT